MAEKTISSIEADDLTDEDRKFIEETTKSYEKMAKDKRLDVRAYNTPTWNGKTEMYIPDDIPQR